LIAPSDKYFSRDLQASSKVTAMGRRMGLACPAPLPPLPHRPGQVLLLLQQRRRNTSSLVETLQDMVNPSKALSKSCALRMLHAGDVLPGWELQPGGVQPCGALRKSETRSRVKVMLTILCWARDNKGGSSSWTSLQSLLACPAVAYLAKSSFGQKWVETDGCD